MRNVEAGNRKVALVIDDLVSIDPFIARSIRIYGEADSPLERDVGLGVYMQIRPVVSWSWNMAGEPAGDVWYEPHRTVHA